MLCTIPKLIWVKKLEKQGKIKERDQIVSGMAQRWAISLVKLSGSKIEVSGQEHLPKDTPVLFVSNHQSSFDVPILLGFIDKPKGFIAKKEIKRLPIVGAWMQLMQCVFMDRRDVRQSLQAINQGAVNLKNGYSLVVFPEGTRSLDGKMLEFKPGSLKLALKSGVPIVPVTIQGTYKIMEKNSWIIRPSQVKVKISPPVDTQAFEKDAPALSQHIFEIIEKNL